MFSCDPNNVNAALIKAHLERELCALLIPFVVIKKLRYCLAAGRFSFSLLLLWTEMPVAYFQLMYSRVLEAFSVSCRQSF